MYICYKYHLVDIYNWNKCLRIIVPYLKYSGHSHLIVISDMFGLIAIISFYFLFLLLALFFRHFFLTKLISH